MQCPQGPDHNSMHIRGLAGPAAASESGATTSVWPSKTENFAHSGRETAQKRPRNGWRNGRVSAKVTASASPRGDQRSWGVALPSDQASRRSSPARDRGPLGPFFPTLYLNIFNFFNVATFAHLTFGALCTHNMYSCVYTKLGKIW